MDSTFLFAAGKRWGQILGAFLDFSRLELGYSLGFDFDFLLESCFSSYAEWSRSENSFES